MTPFSTVGGAVVLAAAFVHGDGTLGGAKWLILQAFLILYLMWGKPLRWEPMPLLFYAAISLLWSSDPGNGAYQILNALGLVAVFMAAPYLNVRLIAKLGLLGAVILGTVSPEFYGGFGNENFITSFILIAMPLSGWASVFGAVYLLQNGSVLEWGVLLAVALYFAFKWRWWAGIALLALCFGFVVYGLTNVVPAPLESIAWSLGTRVELWANTFRLWLEAPLFGHGFGSFAYEYPRFMEWFPVKHVDGITTYAGAAHNEYLQLLSELGIVGAILCVPLFLNIKHKAPLFVAGVLAFVDLPLQNAPTAVLVALVLGAGCGVVRGSFVPVKPRLWAGDRRPF